MATPMMVPKYKVSYSDVREYYLEGRTITSFTFTLKNINYEFCLDLGIGYRYFMGKFSDNSYDRASNYLYTPIKVNHKYINN
jgi:hypothetical protein